MGHFSSMINKTTMLTTVKESSLCIKKEVPCCAIFFAIHRIQKCDVSFWKIWIVRYCGTLFLNTKSP